MGSRLMKALRELGEKCTIAGTEIQGDNVDGIIECIAEHFSGGGSGECKIKYIYSPTEVTSLRTLETGLYLLYGYFTPYVGSNVSMLAPAPSLTSIINDEDITYVQIYFAYRNQIQYLEIKDDWYERTNVYLNKLVIPVAEFQKIMEYAAKYTLDYKCETVSEVVTALSEKVSFAKLIVNITDSATGEALTNATHQVTGEEIWLDSHYHLQAGAYTLRCQCSGYTTVTETITIKSADVTAGEKIIDVAMTASA